MGSKRKATMGIKWSRADDTGNCDMELVGYGGVCTLQYGGV